MRNINNRPELDASDIVRINAQFVNDAEKYNLLYRCSDCVHRIPGGHLCSLGYPNEMLALGEVRALDEDGRFVFCKDFELEG